MFSVDLKDMLVADGVGTFAASTGWSIFVGREPEVRAGVVPETTITIYDTGGFDPNPGLRIDHPTAQIRLRGAVGGLVALRNKATEIRIAMLGRPASIVNLTRYDGIYLMGDVALIGFDEENRPLMTINLRAYAEPGDIDYRQPFGEGEVLPPGELPSAGMIGRDVDIIVDGETY